MKIAARKQHDDGTLDVVFDVDEGDVGSHIAIEPVGDASKVEGAFIEEMERAVNAIQDDAYIGQWPWRIVRQFCSIWRFELLDKEPKEDPPPPGVRF